MKRELRGTGLLLDVLVPVLIRLVEMAVSFVFLASSAGAQAMLARLTEWDANYYREIADHGYPTHIVVSGSRLVSGARFAFSPLFPSLAALVRIFGVSTRTALVVVGVTGGLAASVMVHLLASRIVGTRKAGYVACALLGALPMAITLQMGYAESVAIALSAASLLHVFERRWWWAAGFAFAAGLTRPTAIVVALAIPAAAWSARKTGTQWRTIIPATVLAAAGAPLFWLYVWIRSGVPDGWFVVQKYGWYTHFDWGVGTVKFFQIALGFQDHVIAGLAVVSILGYALVCAVVLRRGSPAALVVVGVASVALALGSSNFWYSKPRLLLSAFPLVVVAARPLSRLPNVALLVVVGAGVVLSAWFGAYAVSVWPYAI